MKKFTLGLNPGVYGLNYHDPSVCLIDDNGIVFSIEEERLNNIKHSCGLFPTNAVKECKHIADKQNGIISEIAIAQLPQLWNKRFNNIEQICDQRMVLSTKIKSLCDLPTAKVSFFEHHKAHAASAYYCSGFSRALCIVIDGAGELTSTSVWLADGNYIKKLDEISMPNSLGYFYASATEFLGFKAWSEEGKLMALAPYGTHDEHISKVLEKYFYNNCENYDVSSFIEPCLKKGFLLDTSISNKIFQEAFGISPRISNGNITKQHKDFAYEIQNHIEKAVKNYINKWLKITATNCVCAAGGLFMNCKMNGYLRDTLPIKKIFIQPVSGDAGTALGAGLLSRISTIKRPIALNGLSLGLDFSDSAILEQLKKTNLNYKYTSNISKETAEQLADNKIVAWFQGRCELGSRALCHRSILAPPNPSDISDQINFRIKHRELWRPFACSILEEYAKDILINYNKSQQPDFMIEAFNIKEGWTNKMSAVIHKADHTTRPQIIRKNGVNRLMHELLEYYYELTENPMVLNTSFNDKGQPIITTPKQAIQFFINHNIDVLSIGNYIVRK